MGMEWQRLLSPRRLGTPKGSNSDADNRSPYQRDFDRIVFSSAFRRMQDKTQVFPLPESDYVRTRLTHSLEVASIGRSLGEMVGASVLQKYPELKDISKADFAAIVGSACLAHDIGNPPFGHSGEEAIRSSFTPAGPPPSYLAGLHGRDLLDLKEFEGNAQGFRVLTRLQNANHTGGLQLTMATLATFMKYPRESKIASEPGLGKGQSNKKFGFFQAEADLATEVAEETGLLRRHSDVRAWCRHPLAFLVEAADDMCYRIIDFEDGFKLGLVPFEEAAIRLSALTGGKVLSKIKAWGKKEQIEYLRALAFRNLIPEVVSAFLKHEKELLAGTFDDELVTKIPAAAELEAIREYCRENVYTCGQVVEIEAAGFEVLGGLVNFLLPALIEFANDPKAASPRSRKYVQLLPPFVHERLRQSMTTYELALTVTDFVSGMTDSYAVSWFKKITGMSLPNG